MPLRSIKKQAPAPRYKVHLVSIMRLLRIVTTGCVKFNRQRTLQKNGDSEIAGRWGTFGQRIRQTNVDDSRGGLHGLLWKRGRRGRSGRAEWSGEAGSEFLRRARDDLRAFIR